MDSTNFELNSLRQDITENILQLKAIIQDVNNCAGPLAELQNLNSAGRQKITALRKFVNKFGDVAKENKSPTLLKEVVLQREQLASTMDSFKKANLRSMLAIEKNAKEELIKPISEESALRQRAKRDKESMVKTSSNVTDQLLSISRQLADTTKRSADTLDALITSSDTVVGTKDELTVTSGTINQSGKLLAKYGRREMTDKILMLFAFAFFLCMCILHCSEKVIFIDVMLYLVKLQNLVSRVRITAYIIYFCDLIDILERCCHKY